MAAWTHLTPKPQNVISLLMLHVGGGGDTSESWPARTEAPTCPTKEYLRAANSSESEPQCLSGSELVPAVGMG